METKQTEPQIENFVIGENQGYMLLAYEELENNSQANSFSFTGKLNLVAECLYSCMKKNEILANVIVAAANALVQNRVIESRIQAEADAAKKEKGKKKKKTN